jgi:hypothetical protein
MTVRAYIRHPADMPIELALIHGVEGASNDPCLAQTYDVSLGGLSFSCAQALTVGTYVTIRIPIVTPPYEVKARVVWCIESSEGHEAGIQFCNTEDAYQARMVEQICHIEHYRKWVQQIEGRELDTEVAAQEWIGKYAKDFPSLA